MLGSMAQVWKFSSSFALESEEATSSNVQMQSSRAEVQNHMRDASWEFLKCTIRPNKPTVDPDSKLILCVCVCSCYILSLETTIVDHSSPQWYVVFATNWDPTTTSLLKPNCPLKVSCAHDREHKAMEDVDLTLPRNVRPKTDREGRWHWL